MGPLKSWLIVVPLAIAGFWTARAVATPAPARPADAGRAARPARDVPRSAGVAFEPSLGSVGGLADEDDLEVAGRELYVDVMEADAVQGRYTFARIDRAVFQALEARIASVGTPAEVCGLRGVSETAVVDVRWRVTTRDQTVQVSGGQVDAPALPGVERACLDEYFGVATATLTTPDPIVELDIIFEAPTAVAARLAPR